MVQPQPEKRSTRRFALDLPITVKFPQNGAFDVKGRTRDVSSKGVFLYVESELTQDSPIEFVMTLPPEITLADPIRVQCSGRVVRVDSSGKEQGVAVAIDRYDFLSAD